MSERSELYKEIKKEKSVKQIIRTLPFDDYTRGRLDKMLTPLLPSKDTMEYFTMIRPRNKSNIEKEEIFDFLKSVYATLETYVMPEYTYVHFRYLPTQKNYRVVINRDSNITIGRRCKSDDEEEHFTSNTFKEFQKVTNFVKEKFDKLEFENESGFLVNIREFDYTWLVEEKIDQIISMADQIIIDSYRKQI